MAPVALRYPSAAGGGEGGTGNVVLGWAGSEVETPQHPEQPGSISTGSAGEFCSLRASLVPPHQALKGAGGDWGPWGLCCECSVRGVLGAGCTLWGTGSRLDVHGAVCSLPKHNVKNTSSSSS